MDADDLTRSSEVASGTPRRLHADNESPIWLEGKPWPMGHIGLSIPVLARINPDAYHDPKVKTLIADARKIDNLRRMRMGEPLVEHELGLATQDPA